MKTKILTLILIGMMVMFVSGNTADAATKTNMNGSTNIRNGGYVAAQGEKWIYSSMYRSQKGKYVLYKVSSDGTRKKKLSQHSSRIKSINVEGNWIYYSAFKYIYRIKTDGTKKQKLCKVSEGIKEMIVKKGWIYYAYGGIYKMKTNGKRREKLCEDGADNLQVVGDWIYYTVYDGHDAEMAYRIKTDGTKRKQLNYTVALTALQHSFSVVGKWIYYSDLNGLYRIRTNGTKKQRISKCEGADFNILGGWIYFTTTDAGSDELYKVKVNGKEEQKIYNDLGSDFLVVGDWVYFWNYDDGVCYYRIKTDGTNEQLMYRWRV